MFLSQDDCWKDSFMSFVTDEYIFNRLPFNIILFAALLSFLLVGAEKSYKKRSCTDE